MRAPLHRLRVVVIAATRIAATLLVVSGSAVAKQQPSPPRPNIVFILADDLGYGDVACFGEDRCRIATPNFDRLAREGMRFTDAHANASICVPTRMAIMTGRYPWRFAAAERGGPWGFLGLRFPPTQHTLARVFKSAGYHTGYVGKWHLGTRMTTTDGKVQGPENVDYTQPLQVGPNDFGFDHSFILPGSLDMYPYAYARNHHWQGKVTARKGWSAFNRVGPAAESFEDHEVLATFRTEAKRYLASRAAADSQQKPFFLFLALTTPHTPLSPGKAFEGKSQLGVYGDFVMETDDCLAAVLDSLQEHGLEQNTLVIATSDHGPASYAGRERKATFDQNRLLQKDGHFSSGVYRGYKFSVYEGGHRVPFVARWPGVIEPGTTCDRLVALQDLMATSAELAGVKLEANQAVDSISFAPLLRDPASTPPRTRLIIDGARGRAVRVGDWKLCLCPGSGSPGTYGNRPRSEDAWRKAVENAGQVRRREQLSQPAYVQLFNLADDPGETKNLAAAEPQRVREMLKLIAQDIERGRSTPGEPQDNGRDNLRPFVGVPPFVFAR